MASSSLLLSPLSSTVAENRELSSGAAAFLHNESSYSQRSPGKPLFEDGGSRLQLLGSRLTIYPNNFEKKISRMGIVPAVTELIIAQFMWLDYDSPTKPIYLYINSPGTQNENMETVGSETEAYAIADAMAYCKSDVYTVNCGMAFGQAAMLLSVGAKGYRALQPNSFTKLYLPKVNRSSGSVIDMWIKAKELDANTEYYLELLAKGIGKPKEEIENDIQRPKYFQAQEAIDYGIADKIIAPEDAAFEKRNYEQLLAQSKAMRRAAGAGPQAAPSGFR
ncbi:ATP-dependent Clp protease proteolytic subunit-related protein 1, chloroplastic [Sesamum angolense]|uniref:ATP-dependent Clp protease proteolytic subunit n=1 Tax=Sesamum angolense TaxID=2727404 RepID=A0AAE2BXV3_9LAMI|nr:ATP-dependent Clp protease proteolytic subunit-related protein 1, chloroplastic [Sesamum angolense]